ncbi:MAG TPA: type IX secretion system protein PorQ, partial [Bacteroidales bacterium]|nr:type IX secretion system protein PorQ [Bacteroidales bacterium]
MKHCILLFVLFLSSLAGVTQIGGTHTYDFLNLVHSARVASLGGNVVAINDNDINLTYHNPALLSNEMNQDLVLNYVNYFTDINYGYAAYASKIKDYGIFSGGINYINYGKFIAADEKGIVTGEFKAAEYAINLIYSRAIDSTFRLGVNVKPIISTLEKYTSFGIAADLGIIYNKPGSLFTAALVIKNLGTQLKTYTGNREQLPFNIQLGISQKLKHAPLLFSITLDHLERWDLAYEKPETNESLLDPVSGTESSESTLDKVADEFMRHVIIGIEFSPIKNFYVSGGYNYRRRQEMLIESKTSTIGFSWGFGIKISKFYLSYGRATYHLAGASDHFSIRTNLDSFRKN